MIHTMFFRPLNESISFKCLAIFIKEKTRRIVKTLLSFEAKVIFKKGCFLQI